MGKGGRWGSVREYKVSRVYGYASDCPDSLGHLGSWHGSTIRIQLIEDNPCALSKWYVMTDD